MMTRLPWKSVAILVAAGVIACGVGFWYRTAKGTIAIQLENPLPHAFKNNPEGMAWLVLLVAFLTAAIVQLWKELSDFRSDYQRETVRKWLAKREMAAEKRSAAERPPRETAAGQLEALASGDLPNTGRDSGLPHERAFYHLPAEQMMGQFANAAEIAISDPERYMALFIVLAVRSGLALDARQGLAGTDDSHYEKLPPDVQYLLLHNVDFVEKRFPEGKVKKRKETEGESDDKMSKLEQECARLRSEMSLNAQRSLDGLQVELTRGWRFKIAAACLVVSTLVSVFAVPLICSFRSGTGSGNGITFWTILFGIGFCALAGTLFAPFAHDAMACIRRIGR